MPTGCSSGFPRPNERHKPHQRNRTECQRKLLLKPTLKPTTARTEESRPSSGTFAASNVIRAANATPDGLRKSAILGFSPSHSRASTDPSSDRTLPSPGWLSECSGRFLIRLMFGTGQSTTTYPAYSQSSKIHLSFGPTRPTPRPFLCLHHFHF